uniref:CUB domain-containing protein n=1 Tax=Panagrolaimus sp. PS1159 TaxID=55785 RepID=A0AC35FHH9_9BILA
MQECVWQFKGPKGYGFKFILTNFDERNTDLLVTNSTDYTITDGHHTHRRQVFYNGDNNLIVYYQGKTICNSSAIDYLFEAQITIIKNEWTEIDADCKLTENNGSTILWSAKNSNSIGYLNNAQCSYNFTVKPDTQIVATILKLRIECNVDILEYKDGDEDEWIPIQLPGSTHVFRYNQKSKSLFPIIWRFKSDGSIQNYGFKVQFETIKCQCAYETIVEPCEGKKEYSIMGVKPYRVCGNLRCNITIIPNKNCPTQRFSMTIFRALECADVLTFFVYSNNQLMLNSSDFRLNYKTTFLLPAKNPKIERVILTLEKPTFAIEMVYVKENTIIAVELSKELVTKSDKLEMYA